jgi:hypothetical protein
MNQYGSADTGKHLWRTYTVAGPYGEFSAAARDIAPARGTAQRPAR